MLDRSSSPPPSTLPPICPLPPCCHHQNAMLVGFFRELADAEAAVGNTTGGREALLTPASQPASQLP